MGRQLLAARVNLEQSLQMATEIAAHVDEQAGVASAALARPKLEPAVLIRPDLILCGFYPGPVPEIEQLF